MWRLFHFLFGWDYVQWESVVSQGVARVHVDGEGLPYYYWQYRSIAAERITEESNVIWLTCPREKYLQTRLTNVIWVTCPREKYLKTRLTFPREEYLKNHADL